MSNRLTYREKFDLNDSRKREALLETYNYKCVYSGEPLAYTDLQIDHIIPRKLRDDQEQLFQLLCELGLPPDFELDSLYNLVPTTKHANQLKRDTVFQPQALRYFLAIAESKAPEVEKNIEKSSRRLDKERLEKNIDLLTNEKSSFEENFLVLQGKCTVSRSRVWLEGFLPSPAEPQGSCLLMFKSPLLRDCMITFSHSVIVTTLFRGLFSGEDFHLRGFFVYKDSDTYCIQLGNTRFTLPKPEFAELCWVVDEFAKLYLKGFDSIEKTMETRCFRRSKFHKDGYRLLKVKKSLWSQLLRYANLFDITKGRSERHIFNSTNPNVLRVCRDHKKPPVKDFFHFTSLLPERVDHYYELFQSNEDSIWITWVPTLCKYTRFFNNANEWKPWTAMETYKWLIDELIPHSLFLASENETSSCCLDNLSYKMFSETFNILNYAILGKEAILENLEDVSSKDDCVRVIDDLQQHFGLKLGRDVHKGEQLLASLYTLLIHYINRNPLSYYRYLLGCLHLPPHLESTQLASELARLSKDLQGNSCSSSVLDLALRGLKEVVLNGDIHFDEKELKKIRGALEPLWKHKEVSSKLRRMQTPGTIF